MKDGPKELKYAGFWITVGLVIRTLRYGIKKKVNLLDAEVLKHGCADIVIRAYDWKLIRKGFKIIQVKK